MISVNKRSILTAALVAGGMFAAAPAYAQATRTWVSGVGDDANPCSRTAPCKTFAGSISKTAAGGEINCIDPAGYGAVTITKSITIRCEDVMASILVAGSPAITINAGDNDYVLIDGIDLYGLYPTNLGTNGINLVNAGRVQVRNTTIHGFGTQGINVNTQAGKTQSRFLDNVIFEANGSATTGTGAMKVAVQGTGATSNVVLNNTRFFGNANAGERIDDTGSTGGTVNLTVDHGEISNSGLGIQLKAPAGTASINAVITDTVITTNTNFGIQANGSGVKGLVTRSSIMMNNTGVSAINSAVVNSSGDNNLNNNTTDGAFSGTTPHL